MIIGTCVMYSTEYGLIYYYYYYYYYGVGVRVYRVIIEGAPIDCQVLRAPRYLNPAL